MARSAILLLLIACAWATATGQSDVAGTRELHSQEVQPVTVETQAVAPLVVPSAEVQQWVVTPAPVVPPTCLAYSDAALRASRGVLCVSQHVSHTVEKIICNEWKPECRETVTESQLLDPSATGAAKDAFALTATAACKLMGYTSFGAGTTRVTGATKDTCWNGKAWATDNWWLNLVCCK